MRAQEGDYFTRWPIIGRRGVRTSSLRCQTALYEDIVLGI